MLIKHTRIPGAPLHDMSNLLWLFNFRLRSAKQRLARQLRDKEEEIESQNQKVEALRLEVRKAERAKKEVA